jgi:hypothetical protein
LLVTVADRLWPVSVNALLHDRGRQGQPTCVHRAEEAQLTCPATLADLDPHGSTVDDYLQYPSPLSTEPTGQFYAFERGQGIAPGPLHHWLADPGVLNPWKTAEIYFYYRGKVPANEPGWPTKNPAIAGLLDLEYWFFYQYNYYPTVVDKGLMDGAPLAGDIANTDLHQGDWEHISVLVDPTTLQPKWLWTARHSTEGQYYRWTGGGLHEDGDHVIVQAAFGGHPTYPDHCFAHKRAVLGNLASDWIVCGSGRFAFRAQTTPLIDLAPLRYACWNGHFGFATKTEIARARQNEDSIQRAIDSNYLVAGPSAPLVQFENKGVCATPTGPELPEKTFAAAGSRRTVS